MFDSAIGIAFASVWGIFAFGLVAISISVSRERKQMVAKLAGYKCPACDTTYGFEAASRAPQTYFAQCAESRRQHPGDSINFVREWPVECPSCKHRSYFNYHEQQLHSLSLEERCEQRIKQRRS